jgi:hypothetical protein
MSYKKIHKRFDARDCTRSSREKDPESYQATVVFPREGQMRFPR